MPCMTIAKNAGMDGSVVVAKVEENTGEFGYDALHNEYVNMIERGIIDPTKVSNLFKVYYDKHNTQSLFYKIKLLMNFITE